jgi:hypothetical protein
MSNVVYGKKQRLDAKYAKLWKFALGQKVAPDPRPAPEGRHPPPGGSGATVGYTIPVTRAHQLVSTLGKGPWHLGPIG